MPKKQRILKDWIGEYMKYSGHSEAPDKFHFWTAVSTVAGALRRQVWLDMKYFQWTPNFYIIFVAPPGIVSKSTTLSIGMNLLKKVKGVNFGPDAVTWQALTQALSESTEMVTMPGDGLMHPMSCITIASSEFGTFLNPKDREMVDVLVSLWDGQLGTWEKKTKTQGDDKIANPWINIAACTTPKWIQGNFPDYMIGGGFTSRCIWVYANKKRRLVAYPGMEVPKDFDEQAKRLIHDLNVIGLMKGEMTLSPEAIEFGTQWYEQHYQDSRNKKLDNQRFEGYLARKQTHIHKLAIVLSASRSDSLVIERWALEAAADLATGLEAEMHKVFENIDLSDEGKYAEELLSIIKAYETITEDALYKISWKYIPSDHWAKAVGILLETGQIGRKINGKEVYLYAKYPGQATKVEASTPDDAGQPG